MNTHSDSPTPETEDWVRLQKVIVNSLQVDRHIDFVQWLEQEVKFFLPHEVLVAVWGDFNAGDLCYDVASQDAAIRTFTVAPHAEVDRLMLDLHQRCLAGGEQWFVLDAANLSDTRARLGASGHDPLASMRSVLAYCVRDKRSGQDYLYTFFSREPLFTLRPDLLSVLMPQIDAALRRVDSLPLPSPSPEASPEDDGRLTEREQEIMRWVRAGKTNYEIGLILEISHNTVKNHLKRIFSKLQVSNRAQAVVSYERR